MALQRGDVVDRYRLEEPLGVGAFGEVWRANQLANGEPIGITCALKIMRLAQDRIGSSPRALPSGWLDEAQHLVRVAGTTVPRIHEANVWNEHAYIAMELLAGSTLRARLAHGPLSWRRALFIADQIATALEAAHKLGLIHRDLKPQNVMLVDPQRCCVLDWGIARLHTAAAPASSGLVRQPPHDVDTTDAGPIVAVAVQPHRTPVGTPGYMAPEVYDGAHPSPAQDVFSLGVVLYEMIAGCLPHAVDPTLRTRPGPDSMKAYRASLDKATMDHALTPLRERCPGVPRAVAELVDRLLAHDPAQRPANLRDAIDHAGRFPHGIPDPPYAGLSTLGLAHAGLYFGQRDAIQRVLDHLRSQRAALLWGPSGSGKSSLALAGVAATMDRALFLDLDGWDIHVVRPRDGKGFRVAPEAARPARPAIGQVVVLDQLEEIVDLEPAARDAFCAAVLALLERSAPVAVRDTTIGPDDEVKVIATIRDDLEWRVDREVPALRPLLERRVIVKGVDVNVARSIIEEPARALGYAVEGVASVTREVEDRLSAEPAKLPVVQYALSEWWQRRDPAKRLLPVAAWTELGGVDGALSFVAERFYTALDQDQQQRVKTLFLQLFQAGRKQPLAESALDPDDRALIDELGRLRLVGRRDKKGSEPFYEAEHEYLSTHWARLAGWLVEARDDRTLAEELERDAEAYLRDRDPERLWRKARLAAATEMAQRGRVVLGTTAAQFLDSARSREQRRRLLVRTSIGVGVAAVLGVVYTLVLNAAAATERAQARIELQQAKEKNEQASKLKATMTTELDAAEISREMFLLRAREEADRIRNDADRSSKDTRDKIARDKAQADEQLRAAIQARKVEQQKAEQYKIWANNSLKKANEAEERARLAEILFKNAEERARAKTRAEPIDAKPKAPTRP